jgi:hypothetical protein
MISKMFTSVEINKHTTWVDIVSSLTSQGI